MISLYDQDAIERWRAARRLEPRQLRRAIGTICKHFEGPDRACGELPTRLRDEFLRDVRLHCLTLESRHDSAQDGATKLVFRTQAGWLLESVILRIASGRTSLCVSSQVGCAAACRFCATGRMGVARDLSTSEIVDQVVQASALVQQEGRRVRNIVFMGMGEPLFNEANLYPALELLTSAEYFHHPPTRILVSTVGIPNAMVRLARSYPRVNMALSLHAARQDVRQKIVPLASRYRTPALRTAMHTCNQLQGRPLMVEYVMLWGVNDTRQDADALIEYLDGLNVHVNLIPYNPIDGAEDLQATPRPAIQAFAAQLKAGGLTTTIRYSLGSDITAACGQLIEQRNRESHSGGTVG